MRLRRTSVAVVLLAALSACGSTTSGGSCALRADFEGRTYTQAGVSSAAADPIQGAELLGCAGSEETVAPRLLRVWHFEGHSRTAVVGIRRDDGSYVVLVADDLGAGRRAGILATLAG